MAGTAVALERGGLSPSDSAQWLACATEPTGDFGDDRASFTERWRCGAALLEKLPPKVRRGADEQAAATLILEADRRARDRFLAAHVETVYRTLSREMTLFLPADRLAEEAAALIPGLVPTREEVAAESVLPQSGKEGREIDQGIFLSHVLAHPAAGAHLCHAGLLPTAKAQSLLPRLRQEGSLDLGAATVERHGKASYVTMRNPRFLNAEDETTIEAVETAVDLALLDERTEVAVLRGSIVEHPKYRGRRVFSTGINLTHLYHGKISYLWYIRRELGFVNKLVRGLASPDAPPDEALGASREKPWIAQVDAFAIGGGCQYLLAMDHIVAARDAYMTLPARKEGIIPGAANLRLPRFTGPRIARQLIMEGRRLDCDSPEGRLICDDIAAPEETDAAVERAVALLTDAGMVSAAGNRRAFRVAEEPLDLFRRYMAVYAREQAYCHFSPALIANLERHWEAQRRRP
jgi:(3,5-dihydroxyphenyl)acetyl-CoA 1,2-dioxygenase